MVSGPPSGQLLQVTLLGHWLVFFRTFSISGVFAYLHLTRKTREGLRRADDIVMERVGPVTRLALLLHGWGAIHLLRGNRANQPIGGVLYISEVTTGKSHVIHYTWPNIGWSLAKLKTAKNAKLARTSTLAPHKKVESTDHIFSAIATAANLPISWVAHKGKPQSKNLLNLLLGNFLDFCSGDRWPWRTCIVMVSRSTYDPCSQGPCMAQVPKCVWLFASLCSANWCICLSALSFQEICCTFYPFDRQVPTVHWRFIGSVTTFHAKTAKCESCNSSISHFHFLLTLRYVCISYAKPIGAF